MRPITRIIVHCTDSPDKMDIGAAEITEWHLARGFTTIGYHKVIRRDGALERGRPDETVGAHVEGHNADSLGIVWVGRNKITVPQRASLLKEIRQWMACYQLKPADVYGHCRFNRGKTCPNLDMNDIRSSLAKAN